MLVCRGHKAIGHVKGFLRGAGKGVLAVVLISFLQGLNAAELVIGLANSVTTIDPHYLNVTPNNNVAFHLFGYLVERDENSQLRPGHPATVRTPKGPVRSFPIPAADGLPPRLVESANPDCWPHQKIHGDKRSQFPGNWARWSA